MIPSIEAKPYFDPESEALRFLPEAPRILRNYPAPGARLGWVAIQHGARVRQGSINILDLASGQNTSFPLPGRPGFFVETTRPGYLMIGLERSLVYFDLLTGNIVGTGIEVTDDERVIINDGLAIEGGVLFGTKHLEFNQPVGALYFFDCATGRARTVLGGQICSNGKFFQRNAAGATLIDIDTIPRTISNYQLDHQLEQVLEKSLVCTPDSLPGLPDGLRPAPVSDAAGDGESVIVAFYNPAPVADGVAHQIRLSNGAVICKWRIPGSPRVTCPEFVEVGGAVKLIFTTAVEGMPDSTREKAFGAGTIYIAATPFRSMPAPPPLLPY